LDTLPLFLAYLDTPQTFADVRTREFFMPLGIEVPLVDRYLDTVLGYYVSRIA
jgi:hypothetical protein